ncbi:hypothetical protein [Bradyrhizobium liaoningense]|uniref:hypothetical protein n=1 Tax=Bradyrhizobium liaoningense TaxID=43992 RepID=UPI001BA7815E|nr:hypothetical protein [Bradyrhizobium liaoningense]MBR1171005.1 hypothetical protein [Bradyrhizobium liaoningense]
MTNKTVRKIQLQAGIVSGVLLIGPMIPDRSAQAQLGRTTAPISGGTGISSQPKNVFQGMTGTYAAPHKTPDGRACIAVNPMTRAQTINPKIIDQIVIINNICGQTIKVQVCYAGSSDCIVVPLGGYQRLQRTLGVGSGSASFRYEYREIY